MEFLIEKECKTIPFEKKWQFCVGSGQAVLALRADYTRQLKFIHDELGIKRVRFHGILNDSMKVMCDLSDVMPFPMEGKFEEQSFHQCGIAYDNVIAAGMKPFVELGFIPNKLCVEDNGESLVKGASIRAPKSLEAWAFYIQAFIRYLIHRYGKEEIETWYFEVWNEPDLQGAFFYGTQQDYFELYEVTARAIKEIDSKIMVGGPSTSASKWVKAFLDFCHEKQVPVDFVTTHQYAGDPLIGVHDNGDEAEVIDMGKMMQVMNSIITGLPDDSKPLDVLRATLAGPFKRPLNADVFRKNAMLVIEQAKGYPVYYTEWNMSATFSDYGNDTRMTAAYDIKNALDIEDLVTGSSIWCFSDIFDEMHQFTEEFHGGFGLLTINGIPKPVFYGMKMLAMTGEERMDLGETATQGEVGIAGFCTENEKQFLLFRSKLTEDKLPAEHVTMKVELEQKPKKVVIYRIDEDHTNPLKLWEDMGKPANLNHQEIQTLIEESMMKEEELPYEYIEGTVVISMDMAENDICFVGITL